MDGDFEMPVQRCLYRQSSLEMRLTPEVPPLESDEESSDEELRKLYAPRVVDAVLKSPQTQLDVSVDEEQVTDVNRSDFKNKFALEPEPITTSEVKTSTNQGTALQQRQIYGPQKQEISAECEQTQENILKHQKKLTPEMKLVQETDMASKSGHSRISLPSEERKQSLPRALVYHTIAKEHTNKNVPDDEDGVMRVIPTEKEIKKYDSKSKMATLRPKSPRPAVTPKPEKEESIWDKLGTLGRKKRIKEVQEVQAEGKYAIDSPGNPVFPAIPPEEYELDENEERSMVEPGTLDDPKVQELTQILIEWINDELAPQRIIVQDLAEDLYDGQILQKLLEKLTSYKMDVPEVTQSEEGQKQKLAVVLAHTNNVLGVHRSSPKKWSVESIHSKNIVAILYLLVALARHFRAPIRLPEHVSIKTVIVQKTSGQLSHRIVHENITSAYDDVGMRCERDAFDTLFDHAPDKLQVVKKSMVTFVNKHLNKINLEVTELESQFHDGVYLTLLMGLLEGFFVPLYCFHLTPKDFDQKVHNVAFAFELMEEVGISKLKARPEDIVNMDLKSTLRVLYQLFSRYKDIV